MTIIVHNVEIKIVVTKQSFKEPHKVSQVSEGVERLVLFRPARRDQGGVAAEIRKDGNPARALFKVLLESAEKNQYCDNKFKITSRCCSKAQKKIKKVI
jgi:hypothetical protein